MRLQSRVYVTTRGCEDEAAATATRKALVKELATRLAAGAIAGYEVASIAEEDDWEPTTFEPEPIEAVAQGRLPAVAANVAHDLDDPLQRPAELAGLLDAFGLRFVWESPTSP
jgi:hypothetical protein